MSQKYKTKLKELNMPHYSFRLTGKNEEDPEMIFDQLRRKWVKFTDEEWVRQNFVQYLIREGGYPPGLILVEGYFKWNGLKKRADIIVHNRRGEPVLIVECKSTEVEIDDTVHDQMGEYNKKYQVPYVLFTNGKQHYAFKYYKDRNVYDFLTSIPLYTDLLAEQL
jgi:hypothetical protein